MSITDPNADDVQLDESQGDESTSDAPYAEYLNKIPEQFRDDVAPVFKDWDANVTRKFQDHAEFRKQWEPLQETGVQQRDPTQVSWAMQFLDALERPELIQQWFDGYAQEHGLTPAEAQQEADDFGFQDPQQQLEKLLEERLNPLAQRLEQYDSRFQQQEEAQLLAEANANVDAQVAAIEKEHGKLDEEQKSLLARLAEAYVQSDSDHCIERGWADMQRWQNKYEKDVLQGKLNQPLPAESGGVPSVSPEAHKRIDSDGVKDAALEFLRNNNRA